MMNGLFVFKQKQMKQRSILSAVVAVAVAAITSYAEGD
jgi:hypothetical protein